MSDFCPYCGSDLVFCRGCGEVIRRNSGWEIWMDSDGTGPPAGQYHNGCVERFSTPQPGRTPEAATPEKETTRSDA